MIDRKYAEKLAATIVGDIMKKSSVGFTSMGDLISDFDKERSNILGNVLSKLWDQLMTSCKAYESGKPLLGFEKALACLRRKGVDWNHLSLNMTDATVSLASLNYYLSKEANSFSAGPCVHSGFWGHLPMRWVALSGEDFADFMFEFDELVDFVTKDVDRHLHECKVKSMQYEILCQTIGQLGEQYLKPHGIRWNVNTSFTETLVPVSFNDDRHECICEDIPSDRLAEVFQTIPERMEKQPIPKKRKRNIFQLDNLVIDDLECIFP